MESRVYRVLLCSIVDIKGSIKLPLLIGKLNRNIKGEVQDALFSPSKLLLHSPNKQLSETATDLPEDKSTSLPRAKAARAGVDFNGALQYWDSHLPTPSSMCVAMSGQADVCCNTSCGCSRVAQVSRYAVSR